MNLPDLAASLSSAVTLGIVAAIAFCAIVGFIVALSWAIGWRSR